jgi:hypothetical protein
MDRSERAKQRSDAARLRAERAQRRAEDIREEASRRLAEVNGRVSALLGTGPRTQVHPAAKLPEEPTMTACREHPDVIVIDLGLGRPGRVQGRAADSL